MVRRRFLYITLSLLGLFLLGTVVVLSSVSYYLAIDPAAYLSDHEVPVLDNVTRWNATKHGQVERIPRILHQTWKSDTLPVRWQNVSQGCRDMMPDYQYMLWTDTSSRQFIAENYPWFLATFDNYTYPIQRADAIRYFVLYHYGGIYLDLDIGCLRPLDPLLVYPVILPKTIPVGVSNDLMFAEKGHQFLLQTIHNLIIFDHSWILNYPTVMFSTGPMFLSAQYGLYTSYVATPADEVRILPKSLYGKNAKPEEAPHSFFSHFYGSSWHADDAAFIGFLGTWGKLLMWIGLVVLVSGLVRLLFTNNRQRTPGVIVLPPSATLPYPESNGLHPIFDAVRRARNHALSSIIGPREAGNSPRITPRSRRQRISRGVMFFLPAVFTQSQEIELSSPRSPQQPFSRASFRVSGFPPEKLRYAADLERAGLFGDGFEEDLQDEVPDTGDPYQQSADYKDLTSHGDSRNTSRSTSRSASRNSRD